MGRTYLGTPKGIAIYDPFAVVPNEVAPNPVFRNASFAQDDNGYNELNAEYAALSFSNEQSSIQNPGPRLFRLD